MPVNRRSKPPSEQDRCAIKEFEEWFRDKSKGCLGEKKAPIDWRKLNACASKFCLVAFWIGLVIYTWSQLDGLTGGPRYFVFGIASASTMFTLLAWRLVTEEKKK